MHPVDAKHCRLFWLVFVILGFIALNKSAFNFNFGMNGKTD